MKRVDRAGTCVVGGRACPVFARWIAGGDRPRGGGPGGAASRALEVQQRVLRRVPRLEEAGPGAMRGRPPMLLWHCQGGHDCRNDTSMACIMYEACQIITFRSPRDLHTFAEFPVKDAELLQIYMSNR